jgi:hypothetical protein
MVLAPMANPYLEHTDCGAISPKITIRTVESKNPTSPDVRSARKIERSAFTATFPRRSTVSKRFPFFLIGRIFFAYSHYF